MPNPYSSTIANELREMWNCICKLQQGEAGVTPATPTATVGLVAKPGVATTYMRSDGAPAIDQTINPIWTGIHTFGANPLIKNVLPALEFESAAGADLGFVNFGNGVANVPAFISAVIADQLRITVGTNAAGTFTFGNAGQLGVGNPVAFGTAGQVLTSGGPTGALTWAAPAGGALPGPAPSVAVTLTAQNGTATTFMRSDSAPALSQNIAPLWTAQHKFGLVSTLGNAAGLASLSVQNTSPSLELWNNSPISGDQHRWAHTVSTTGGTYIFRAINDDGTTSNNSIAWQVFRNGATTQDVQIWAGGTMLIKAVQPSAGNAAVQIVGLNNAVLVQPTSITLTRSQSGTVLTNAGATADITYTLPAAVAATVGTYYEFVDVDATFNIKLLPNGTDVILNNGNTTSGAAPSMNSGTPSSIKVICVAAGQWRCLYDEANGWQPGT